ncbi:MAG TPA: hypothetical protein VG916_13335, partial [Gemmatimonadaceae bacterium]|nr:hypothetical protein [Gemmatimonadaceae bacterium]
MMISPGSAGTLPAGYRESVLRGTRLVSRAAVHDTLRAAIETGTLHAWAGARAGARAMQGRGVSWGTDLDGAGPVVVRHSRHGGLLAALTRDMFLVPSRAPHELEVALRLQSAGVATPTVVAFATYAATGPLCR